MPEAADPKLANRMFLGDKPSQRLFALFKAFPVLARLWSEVVSQWRNQVIELLARLAADQAALSRISWAISPPNQSSICAAAYPIHTAEAAL